MHLYQRISLFHFRKVGNLDFFAEKENVRVCLCVYRHISKYIYKHILTPFLTYGSRLFAWLKLFISLIKNLIISRLCVAK